MKQFPLFLFSFLLLFTLKATSQNKISTKFGNVSDKDFANKVYSLDSNASAVILADVGSTVIEGNSKGWFSLTYKQYRKAHILNKNGYDIANVSIYLYADGDAEEVLDKLKAVTYNLENGKVVETKLDVKANVFKDKLNKNLIVKKFTLPNVKEGSIIEYEYTQTSDFLSNLQPWSFQGDYPRVWSEYNLTQPEFFGYVSLTQGFKKFDIVEKKDNMQSFQVTDSRSVGATERFSFNANVTDFRWVMKDVPALKEENFTSTIDNHIAKIEFQLAEKKYPLEYYRYMGTWQNVADNLMKAVYFGEQINKDNGWMKEIIAPLRKDGVGKMDMMKNIYNYVRDNFTCTNHSDKYLGQTLKNLAKTKNGTVAEINLLLTAMLQYENIDASPVLLSTRSNGFTYSIYPLLSQYNYVVTRVDMDGKQYYLDASEPRLGFNHLPLRCYNGHARVINNAAEAIELNADNLSETKFTSAFIINDEKGKLVGSMQQTPGYYESYSIRDRIKEKGKGELEKDIKKGFGMEIAISNFNIDSLEKYDDPLSIRYDFDITETNEEDVLYINPMFGEGYKENPFKSAERAYPVEMPYAMDEIYSLQMEVPAGYVVDELPTSIIVKLNEEDEGLFEYRISQSSTNISFRSRIRISRAFFTPDEYEMLREFFNLVVKKQAEQIVFKKKK